MILRQVDLGGMEIRHLLLVVSVLLSSVLHGEGGITSSYVRSEWPAVDIPLDHKVFKVPKGYNAPQQVHITQGDYDGKAVIISWVTPDEPGSSTVHYGAVQGEYDFVAKGTYSNYTFYKYKSGYTHHCLVSGLEYNTKYYYKIESGESSREFWFVTPPHVHPDASYKFGIIGDLGQTFNSLSTLEHYMRSGAQAVLFLGDLSYADRYQYNDVGVRWDTWGRFVEPSTAYQPWLWSAGNHEVDYMPYMGEVTPFKNYLERYTTPYLASKSSNPLWYSVRRASAHIIVLSSYSPFVKYTPQWRWLDEEFKRVDREKTPWLIVLMHSPIYNSNEAHFKEGESMRAAFEEWFVEYRVDVVFAGHVHAYERSPEHFSPHHLFVFANLHTSFLCFSAAMGSSGDVNWKLEDHPKLPKGKTIGLIVLDGWGESEPDQYNCIHKAPTPAMDSLKNGRPDTWRLIKAHGTAVGLPSEDDMGNSEVGHNALGAGRIYAQGAKLVDLALESGKIYEDEGFKYISESFEKGTVHLIGLLSDGGVHSRLDQVQLLLKGFAERGAKRIRVHILTDGRDVLDGSSVGFVETLESELAELRSKGVDAQVASGGGRMYVTMDRYENDWTVVKRGWDAQVLGEAPHKFKNALEAVKKLRAEPKANDQYLPPFVIVDDSGKAVGPIVDGDAVVTFNFRADRMVMLAKALENEDFDKFDRVRFPKIRYAGMLQYDGELKLPSHYLVSPPLIDRTSGEYLAHNGVRTFACSETVKFGHVTFFWNGNRSGYFNEKLEKYVEIPSDSGISFNEQPKMKALEIAEKARDAILSGNFDQVRVNLPNGDMVGHTGDLDATVVACEAADVAVRMILDAIEKVGGIYVVTADHGNAEDMVKRDKAGKPALDKEGKLQILTSHTLKPVPIAIGGPGLSAGVRFRQDLDTPGLANVAATVMNLHGFVAPGDYEPSLIEVVDK